MTARILIFCGTRAAIEKYDKAGVPILVPLYPREQREQEIAKFRDTEGATLAVLGTFMAVGWHTPSDTFVVFDKSWRYGPSDPETIQAANRCPTETFMRRPDDR